MRLRQVLLTTAKHLHMEQVVQMVFSTGLGTGRHGTDGFWEINQNPRKLTIEQENTLQIQKCYEKVRGAESGRFIK